MKGVILAGGTGTRLYPLTRLVNKHLLPVGRKPMILYGLEKLREAGIEDILLVTGKHSAGLYMDFLGSGAEWGVNLTFKVQEEAGGIAEALALTEPFLPKEEKFVVLLGDNLFEDSLIPHIEKFKQQPTGARVLLKSVDDPRRYGVPTLLGETITEIIEKPKQPKSNYCVTGIYMYDMDVFSEIRKVSPSARGEMEISSVNNLYAEEGKLTYGVLSGWWTDAGTFGSLREAEDRLGSGDDS